MKSYQGLYTDYKTISKNATTANETFGKALINDTQGLVLAYNNWPFLEFTETTDTVASQANYQLPARMRKIMNLTVTVGTTVYRPKPIEESDFWEYTQSLNTDTSDAAQYYYRIGNQVYIYPTPATTGSTITIRGRKRWKDMSFADYVVSTVAAATNADETITGTASVWTGRKPVSGQWIRLTPTSGDGDNEWYEISSITSNTELELIKPYGGTTFTGKTVAYSIGEFSIIPSEYHDLLLWRPLAIYFAQNAQSMTRSERFWRLYDGGFEAGLEPRLGGLMKVMIDEQLEKNEGAFVDQLSAERDNLRHFKIDTISGESWV